MTDIVFICGIPGIDLRKCAETIGLEATLSKPGLNYLGEFTVEDSFVEVAEAPLKKYVPEVGGRDYIFTDCLGLPYSEFVKSAHNAFIKNLEKIAEQQRIKKSKSSFAIAPLHPVYYHQVALEFIHPYNANLLLKRFKKLKLRPRFVISIHDDIFDIYRNLMKPREMFCPTITLGNDRKHERMPGQDLNEEMLLLYWRDRELSASRALGSGLGTRHFLFHKKGRTKTLVDVVFKDKKNVYFSHPISQPKRDINGQKDPKKCKVPDKERGEKFLEACRDIADILGKFTAIVEPTAIDEYRIDTLKLGEWKAKSHLKKAILPPLSWRWPIGTGDRLCGTINIEEDGKPLPIEVEFLEGTVYKDESLSFLKSACLMLTNEIERQITVRDNMLANQSDLVFAYRPFSLPDSPESTGGVSQEMEIILLKSEAGETTLKPALIVYHPESDERNRRKNEFKEIWMSVIEKLIFPSDKAKIEIEKLLIDIFMKNPEIDDFVRLNLKNEVKALLRENKVTAIPNLGTASLKKGSMNLSEVALDHLVDHLVDDTEILVSDLEKKSIANKGIIEFIKEIKNPVELGQKIKQILEGS